MKTPIDSTARFLSLNLLSSARVLTLVLAPLCTLPACSDDAVSSSADGGSHEGPSNDDSDDDTDDTDDSRNDAGRDDDSDADSDDDDTDDSNDNPRPDDDPPDGGPSDPTDNDTSDPTDDDTSDPTDDTSDNTSDTTDDDTLDNPSDTTNGSDDTTDTPEDPQGPEPAAHFFLPTPEVDNTGAPRLKLDQAGGLHAAFPTYVGTGAYYAYCGPGCDEEDDVRAVRFETEMTVLNAMVAVTEDGRPRILLSAWDRIYYGECNENCTDQASWNVGAILRHDNKKEITGESFVLDPDGNPAFILHSYVELFGVAAEPPATHFAYCLSDCTTNAGWFANKLADEDWEGAALRFDQNGGAHVFGAEVKYEVGVPNDRIPVYATCASNCLDAAATWSSLSLNYPAYEDRNKAVSMRPALSLELTSDGKPRVAAILKGEAEDERWVTYMACDGDCTATGDSWSGTIISNNSQIAAGLDLALDTANRPRVVYNLGYSIFQAGCDTGNCTQTPEAWAISPVELVAEMDPDDVILWPNCNVDAWFLHSPNLVLDANGNARVGYQAADMSGGGVSNPDPNQTPCSAGLDMTWTRMTTF